MSKNRRLIPGDIAPPLVAQDWQGIPIDLQTLRGKFVMLSFFRYASCPLCNLRVSELIKAHPTFTERNLVLIAVFQSPAKGIAKHVGKQGPPFLIVPDPKMVFYRDYRVESSWLGFFRSFTLGLIKMFKAVFGKRFLPGKMEGDISRIPADFLIGPDGVLIDTFYGVDIGDHIPLSRIYNGIAHVQ